ncbi:MAG: ROK family protein, partial [Actinomycetota bacterium]|nr:ROK family protein [Actinomycetota bacterium]
MTITIGVDLGGTKCLGVVIDDGGAVVDEIRVPTPRGNDAVVDVLGDVAAGLLERRPAGEVVGIGVGAPGLVDDDGVLRYAPNLPGVAELALAAPLAARLGVPVVVENDA